ncbi:MAG: diaminopimelate decarboxylase [Sphingopyxis sp.]|uniref:diaminopimelate decarboxylase n=1 Tax=Sphingopyxis sp. TaxID=1908224 RepID=UPI002AB91F7C|nr:diaminopimelate decarboxylase [Sphingopyxis sp.]MDZ3832710.1 diaminopimelate decarboxylase [Sphingopyxis sp.]
MTPDAAGTGFWWERDELRYRHGRLTFAGADVAALAATAEGPLYLYSAARIRANLARLREALRSTERPHRVYYAMKANRNPQILSMLAGTGECGIDICSPDELDHALACGFPVERISFTGTGVSRRDMARLLAHDGLTINCDSIGMIDRIGDQLPGREIGIRVNPGRGVGYGDDPRLTYAGMRTTKFGIYREQWDAALATVRNRHLRVTSLHFHVGCGYLDRQLGDWEAALAAGLQFLDQLPDVRVVNIGGGLGLPHRAGDQPLDLARWASALRHHFAGRPVEIAVEPGDYLVKDAGMLVLGVTNVERKRDTLFVSVDGGFNLHPEPAFYGLPCEPVACVPRTADVAAWQRCTIAGNINEALDLWGEDIAMPPFEEGDYIALLNAGGYGAAMSSNHCMRGKFQERLI